MRVEVEPDGEQYFARVYDDQDGDALVWEGWLAKSSHHRPTVAAVALALAIRDAYGQAGLLKQLGVEVELGANDPEPEQEVCDECQGNTWPRAYHEVWCSLHKDNLVVVGSKK